MMMSDLGYDKFLNKSQGDSAILDLDTVDALLDGISADKISSGVSQSSNQQMVVDYNEGIIQLKQGDQVRAEMRKFVDNRIGLRIFAADGTVVHDFTAPDVASATEVAAQIITSPTMNLGSDAWGDVFYTGQDLKMHRLSAGSIGQLLQTNGAGANPSWITPTTVTFKSARVYKSGNQSINDVTPTAIAFDLEEYDTDTFHDNVTQNTRLTIPTTGLYLVKGTIRYAGNSSGYRSAALYVNGSMVSESRHLNGSGSTPEVTEIVCELLNLTAGQYVELYADQGSGGALNVLGSSGISNTNFSIVGPF